jgi:NADPH:quinone reductase-like Zn-dependent oxidoreductase
LCLNYGRGPTKLGVVPISDSAGEVAAIGEGITHVKQGDRAIGTFHPPGFGGTIKPDYLTDQLGANLDGMRNTRSSMKQQSCFCQPTCPLKKPPPCPAPQ